MKRKFAFLAPLRIPSRAENRALKAHLESQAHSHDHDVISPLSPPLSAFIDRRELDDQTEAQLKAACAAVVQSGADEPDQKLNFKPLNHTKSVPHLSGGGKERHPSHAQMSSQIDTRIPPVPQLFKSSKPVSNSKSVQDFRQVNHTPRQNSTCTRQPLHEHFESRYHPAHADPRKNMTISPTYRPRTAPVDESDGSYATPRTASTDPHLDSVSTAFTSTAITPSRPFQRISGQLLKVANEDMGVPVEHTLERLDHATVVRGVDVHDWSSEPIHNDAQRPKTAVESRPIRRDSLQFRSVHAQSFGRAPSSNSSRSTSNVYSSLSQGQLGMSSDPDLIKRSVVGTHFESAGQSLTHIDLNRALPPLPRLDTWRVQQNNESTSQLGSAPNTSLTEPKLHVVDLMRTSYVPAAQVQPAVYKHHALELRSGGDDQAVPAMSSSNSSRDRSAAHSKSSSTATDSCLSPSLRSRAASGSISRSTIPEDGLPTSIHASPAASSPHHFHRARHSEATTTTSPYIRTMSTMSPTDNSGHPNDAMGIPNFSRKISIDMHGGIRSHSSAQVYTQMNAYTDGVTALPRIPPPPPKSRVSGLRRVLSSFTIGSHGNQSSRKSGAVNWMDHFEAEGIKKGILVPRGDGPAAAPIVRY